jgi:hypothetical protein
MDESTFRYAISCSSPGCSEPPRYRIVAPWSDGPLRELKNYGLACEHHRRSLLERALANRERLATRDDEQVGPVEVVELPRSPGPDVGQAARTLEI